MLNKIILIGRLVRDVEMRYTTNGTPVSNFDLAVERDFINSQTNERDVDFIKITTWNKLATICAEHIGKGRLVAVEGSLHIKKDTKNGRTYVNPFVNATKVQFLDFPDNQSNNNQSNNYQNYNNQNSNNQSNNNQNNNNDLDLEDFDVPF